MEWKSVKLGELANINYGYTTKASFEINGPKFLRITDIQNGSVNWSTVPSCEISGKDFAKHMLEADDIVFARTGATTGKSYLIKAVEKSVAASYLIRLRLKSDIVLPEFIHLFFQTAEYWSLVEAGSSGSAQGGFNASKLSNLEINFPPLQEQKRIVALLDTVFADLEKTRAKTEQNLKNARDLFDSYLQQVFSLKGESIRYENIEALSTLITKGSSPKWQGINYVEEPGVLFVTSENVGVNKMLFKKTKYVEESFNDKGSKSILVKGDVLTNIVGASIGRTAIFDQEGLANINQAVCLIRCNPYVLLNEYLTYLLNSPYLVKVLHENEIDNARANLSLGFFRKLEIPVPSIEEQNQVVYKIKAMHLKTDGLKVIYQKKLEALDELKKSILQKAFNGELSTPAKQVTSA